MRTVGSERARVHRSVLAAREGRELVGGGARDSGYTSGAVGLAQDLGRGMVGVSCVAWVGPRRGSSRAGGGATA